MAISTAVDLSAVARVLGIQTQFVDLRGDTVTYLPQRIALIGQGATASVYSNDKRVCTSAQEVGTLYGFGSPLHLAMMKLKPATGGGVGTIPVTVYPLDDDGAGVAAAGSITGTGTQGTTASYTVTVNGIQSNAFVITAGDVFADVATAIAAAINAVLEMPVVATNNAGTVELVAKWKGLTGNEIYVTVDGTPYTLATTVTQPTGGLVNPDVDAALALINTAWDSLVINCASDVTDSATLGKYSTWGDSRWGSLVYKPAVVFTGTAETTRAAIAAIGDARKLDKTNSLICVPGSIELPCQIAAAIGAQVARQANNNPAVDYGSLPVTNLLGGTDAQQYDYDDRDVLVKAGISTTSLRDGVVYIEDTVTLYHPTGDTTPAYRYVCDIAKLQTVIFNTDLIFKGKPWDGAPLIPNGQATVNPAARKPKDAIAELAGLTDNLGLQAIISDPATTKALIQAEINASNPKRLDVVFPISVSGNANILSIDLNFSFFFG